MEIKEKFVTKDIADKLRYIGFEEDCLAQLGNDMFIYPKIFKKTIKRLEIVHLPLWQEVQEWFEVKHNLFIDVFPFIVTASDKKGHRFSYRLINLIDYSSVEDETLLGFLTYNEARELAIYKAIELCKSKK